MYSTPQKRIAVIGAGASGLAAASYLLAEGLHVTLFEERSEFGGVWTNQGTTTQPNPMYVGLETNVPHTLMIFTDHAWPRTTPLFPPYEQVGTYLRTYAEKLFTSPHLVCYLSTKVVSLQRLDAGQWRIQSNGLTVTMIDKFDGVVIAAGNYSEPCMTDAEPGRDDWSLSGNLIIHSSGFSRAESFTGQKVLIVGSGPSGWDLTERISKVAAEVVVSVRSPSAGVNPGASRTVGLIRRYNSETRTIQFHRGADMEDVDTVVYCTGYKFSFPFAMHHNGAPLFPPGLRINNLFEPVFLIDDPSQAFVGLPKMTATFTVAEAQSAIVARVFSGRVHMPSVEVMTAWIVAYQVRQRGLRRSESNFHSLSTRDGEDKEYVNRLLEAYMFVDNPFFGKPPPCWCNCLDSAKQPIGMIRAAFKGFGDARWHCITYGALGAELVVPCSRGLRAQYPIGAATCFLDPATR